jgi:xanthine/uracil permease
MIGLVGAKIWVENGVDFGDPVNMVGLAGGLIAGIGGVTLTITDNFELSGIALGTILVIVYFHLVNNLGGNRTHYTTQALSHPDEPTEPYEPGHRSDPAQE